MVIFKLQGSLREWTPDIDDFMRLKLKQNMINSNSSFHLMRKENQGPRQTVFRSIIKINSGVGNDRELDPEQLQDGSVAVALQVSRDCFFELLRELSTPSFMSNQNLFGFLKNPTTPLQNPTSSPTLIPSLSWYCLHSCNVCISLSLLATSSPCSLRKTAIQACTSS